MEVKISVEDINCERLDKIEYEAEDTIIITGNENLDWDAFADCLIKSGNSKPFHLVLENGQKELVDCFEDSGRHSWLGKLLSFSAPALVRIGENVFGGCVELSSIYLPSLRVICYKAFYMCESLKRIEAPKVKIIGDNAFGYCDSLEEVCFPEAKIVGEEAFYHCLNLNKVILPQVSEIEDVSEIFQGDANIREINISSLKEVQEDSFIGFKNLRSIDISSAEEIGEGAFSFCFNLRTVKAPKVRRIRARAFHSCEHIGAIEFPGVEIIEENAFSDCFRLKEISCEELIEVGDRAFEGCKFLESINLPKVVKIGEGAFFSCDALREVTMLQTTDVEDSAFQFCKTLKIIHMPLLKKVGSKSFGGCHKIETLEIPEEVEVDHDSFSVLAARNNVAIRNIQGRILKECFAMLVEEAEKGEAKAQLELGRVYANGKYERAIDRFSLSYEVDKNMDMAIDLWEKSSAQKNPEAMYILAQEYLSGENIKCDQAEAMKLLTSSAERGFLKSQLALADMYKEGKYLIQDIEEARKWYRVALRNGSADALKRLIKLQEEYPKGEQREPEDETEAVYFKAEHGDIEAIRTISSWYMTGTDQIGMDTHKGTMFHRFVLEKDWSDKGLPLQFVD